MTFFLPVPFPPCPFGLRRLKGVLHKSAFCTFLQNSAQICAFCSPSWQERRTETHKKNSNTHKNENEKKNARFCTDACNTPVYYTMGPEMITQIIRKQFLCVTDVCVIEKLIPRQLMCVIGASTESTLCKRPITQNNSCPNALCNRCPV